MANLGGFNASDYEPVGFDTIPEGRYLACISKSEMRTNRAGTGEYLWLEMEILEGQFKGRKLWHNLNLNNPSEMAMAIARGELSSICKAVGIEKVEDSEELHNLPMCVSVGIQKDKDSSETRNRVKAFYPKEKLAEKPGNQAPNKPASTPAKPANTGKMPWQKG